MAFGREDLLIRQRPEREPLRERHYLMGRDFAGVVLYEAGDAPAAQMKSEQVHVAEI